MSSMTPRKNALALCGHGSLGLITSDEPEVLYFSGEDRERICWTGIHLTDKTRKPGSFWCSSNPKVIGYLEDIYKPL